MFWCSWTFGQCSYGVSLFLSLVYRYSRQGSRSKAEVDSSTEYAKDFWGESKLTPFPNLSLFGLMQLAFFSDRPSRIADQPNRSWLNFDNRNACYLCLGLTEFPVTLIAWTLSFLIGDLAELVFTTFWRFCNASNNETSFFSANLSRLTEQPAYSCLILTILMTFYCCSWVASNSPYRAKYRWLSLETLLYSLVFPCWRWKSGHRRTAQSSMN